jgi:hypothetical protein
MRQDSKDGQKVWTRDTRWERKKVLKRWRRNAKRIGKREWSKEYS